MPPECVDGNAFELSAQEKKERGIEELPGTLIEAIYRMEKDKLVEETLGEHTYHKYIEAKKEEWYRYRSQVTDWEIDEYLNTF
jgi:glutamine synthetase